MSGIQILVIEDEIQTQKDLKRKLSLLGYQEVLLARNSQGALKIIKDKVFDIVLMDIGLSNSNLDGIELAKIINKSSDAVLIFITSFSDDTTVGRSNEVAHHNYLIKPVSERQLYVSILKALSLKMPVFSEHNFVCPLSRDVVDSIYVKGKDQFYNRLYLKDVKYLSTSTGGTYIHTVSQKPYTYTSLKAILDVIDPKKFIRIHNTMAINLDYVIGKSENEIKLSDGTNQKIGKAYQESIQKHFTIIRPNKY